MNPTEARLQLLKAIFVLQRIDHRAQQDERNRFNSHMNDALRRLSATAGLGDAQTLRRVA